MEVVIDEARTHLRLSARTLRSLTAQGVVQEIYALLLAHLVVRTLMLTAAEGAGISPQQLSCTETLRILEETLLPLGLVEATRRESMVQGIYREIGQQRLPPQRVRIQPRVVKRVRSRYERKKPEHSHVPVLELEVEFQHLIELVMRWGVEGSSYIKQYWGTLAVALAPHTMCKNMTHTLIDRAI